MELKDYQIKVVDKLKEYLTALDKARKEYLELCNELGTKKAWKELDLDFPDKKMQFQVVFEDEWRSEINKIFG